MIIYEMILKKEYMMQLTTYNIWVDAICGTVQGVCTLVNLILLIFFTQRAWKNSKRKDDEAIENERQRIILERKEQWHNRIITDRLVENIEKYFIDIEKIVMTGNSDQREIIKKLREIQIKNKRLLVPYLEIFSHEFTQSVSRSCQEYYDVVIECVEKTSSTYRYLNEQKLNEKKANILKQIYQYDIDNILQ